MHAVDKFITKKFGMPINDVLPFDGSDTLVRPRLTRDIRNAIRGSPRTGDVDRMVKF